MWARWVIPLVVLAGAAPAEAEPEATCAAACQRLALCKLASADACIAGCKQGGDEATSGGRARLVAVVRASCDQLAAAHKAQTQPAPRAQPGPQAQPASQSQRGPQAQPAPRASASPRTPPAQHAQPAPQASSAPSATTESDKHVWRCTSEGSYEVLRKGEIYWRPASTSAFGFGKTQQLAITMSNASCGNHMNGMMVFANTTGQTRIKTPCRPTQCTPPP